MADTYCRCGDPECPIHLGLSDNDKPSYFVRHAHTEYVEGCFRCDLSREETRDTTPRRGRVVSASLHDELT